MKNKLVNRLIASSLLFLVGVGFIGNTATLSANSISMNEMYNNNLYMEMVNDGQINEVNVNSRAIILAPILILIGKWFGGAVVAVITKTVASMGMRSACSKYHNANGAWDFFCDSVNQYGDLIWKFLKLITFGTY
ncbi:MAG: hypothetical protein ACRC5R_01795 [Mycoplasmatales bacterium]